MSSGGRNIHTHGHIWNVHTNTCVGLVKQSSSAGPSAAGLTLVGALAKVIDCMVLYARIGIPIRTAGAVSNKRHIL